MPADSEPMWRRPQRQGGTDNRAVVGLHSRRAGKPDTLGDNVEAEPGGRGQGSRRHGCAVGEQLDDGAAATHVALKLRRVLQAVWSSSIPGASAVRLIRSP